MGQNNKSRRRAFPTLPIHCTLGFGYQYPQFHLLLRIIDRYTVQTKNTRLSYNTRNAGLTKAIFITVAGIQSFPIDGQKNETNRVSFRKIQVQYSQFSINVGIYLLLMSCLIPSIPTPIIIDMADIINARSTGACMNWSIATFTDVRTNKNSS
jgi:hypothetical protein